MTKNTRQLTGIAMLAALAFMVMMMFRIPISPLPFLKYDPKDIIIVMAGFIYSPLASVIISVVVSTIEMVTVSSTGIIGFTMNVVSTLAFALPATIIYKKTKSIKGAIIGLAIGVSLMTIVMVLWNYLLTPLYMKIPREEMVAMLVPFIMPFNLIKGGLNSVLTILIYKPTVTALRRANLVQRSSTPNVQGGKFKVNIGVTIGAIAVLVTLILIILVMKGII